jgi:hypothetical protein
MHSNPAVTEEPLSPFRPIPCPPSPRTGLHRWESTLSQRSAHESGTAMSGMSIVKRGQNLQLYDCLDVQTKSINPFYLSSTSSHSMLTSHQRHNSAHAFQAARAFPLFLSLAQSKASRAQAAHPHLANPLLVTGKMPPASPSVEDIVETAPPPPITQPS